MITLSCVSALLRLIAIIVTSRLIMRLSGILNKAERLGLGLIGGSGLMTVAVILDINHTGTPFDVWSGPLLSVGIICFFTGFMERKLGHERRNKQQKKLAEEHFDRKAHR